MEIGTFELNKIYCMDCLEAIKKIPDETIDLIITDPPYNIGDESKRTKIGNNIISTMEAWGEWDSYSKFDYDLMICEIISHSFRVLKGGGYTIYVYC